METNSNESLICDSCGGHGNCPRHKCRGGSLVCELCDALAVVILDDCLAMCADCGVTVAAEMAVEREEAVAS